MRQFAEGFSKSIYLLDISSFPPVSSSLLACQDVDEGTGCPDVLALPEVKGCCCYSCYTGPFAGAKVELFERRVVTI